MVPREEEREGVDAGFAERVAASRAGEAGGGFAGGGDGGLGVLVSKEREGDGEGEGRRTRKSFSSSCRSGIVMEGFWKRCWMLSL